MITGSGEPADSCRVFAGAGMMHVSIEGRLGALHVSRTLPAMDVGGGVTGFLNEHVGLNWEVRHFRSVGGNGQTTGATFDVAVLITPTGQGGGGKH